MPYWRMRNITGSPVEGDDFFDRETDIARIERELRNAANILLTAPRRVGKTSLVLRVCERQREAGNCAVFLNVEGCGDELSFAERLVEALRGTGIHPEMLGRISLSFRKARQALRGMKLGAGIDLDMGDVEDPDQSTLGRALESMFRKIEAEGKQVVLAIDEVPEFLLALGREEDGGEGRVGRFLHWLRSLRQSHRPHVRWIFLGSIGLDSFVDERGLRKTINDLTPLGLSALGDAEAEAFLAELGATNGLPIPSPIRAEIIGRMGWALPHHLQIFFHALVDAEVSEVDAAAINAAFARLLQPASLGQFDTWRQRLDEQFDAEDATVAKAILRHLCQHRGGRT